MSEQELLDLTSPPHRVVSLVPSLTEIGRASCRERV